MNRSDQYQRYIFPLLSRVDPEAVHERTLSALALAQRWSAGRAILHRIAGKIPQEGVQLFGLNFPNVLGVAAGFDKNVRVAPGLAALGFGHIETGTITPNPQAGNPKPRVFRLPQDKALINRMGFPSAGADAAVARLRDLAQAERRYVLGVSIGKQKETALVDAVIDYVAVLHATYIYADYLAINISSPNTPELRKLQGSLYLPDLLSSLMSEGRMLVQKHGIARRPLLIKIAPDLTWDELDEILQVAMDQGIDGIIATNTTVNRAGLKEASRSERGGLSGAPLSLQSTKIIRYIAQNTDGKLPIVGVGGIRSAADVQAKIDAGASLVQLYTGLVYGGPGLAGRILRRMTKPANVANLQTKDIIPGMNKRVEAIVFGYVQGVSYRYYTRREAERLRLTGWVANQYDGTVKVVAEGPQDSLQELAGFLLHGSPAARVEHVKADWLDATNEFSNFNVRHL